MEGRHERGRLDLAFYRTARGFDWICDLQFFGLESGFYFYQFADGAQWNRRTFHQYLSKKTRQSALSGFGLRAFRFFPVDNAVKSRAVETEQIGGCLFIAVSSLERGVDD